MHGGVAAAAAAAHTPRGERRGGRMRGPSEAGERQATRGGRAGVLLRQGACRGARARRGA